MRIFALSDIHADYDANARWLANLSSADYRNDVLILAGDVTDNASLLEWCLTTLAKCFQQVLFVPGNHELWVTRDRRPMTSLQKFDEVVAIAARSGVSMRPFRARGIAIVPLLAWYDYSFGQPTEELKSIWMDFRTCRWPPGFDEPMISAHFAALNEDWCAAGANEEVITFSHFLPRIDLMPRLIPREYRALYPILGTSKLERQLRRLNSTTHIFGHSHINRQVQIDGVSYVNNAFGYPHESRIAAKRLVCVRER